MVKRFLIAAMIVGLFLGGVGYFNLVFKPKMIGEFMKKMVPPPATVTAEAAGPKAGATGCGPSARWSPSKAWMSRRSWAAWSPSIISRVVTTSPRATSWFKLDTSVEEADLADNKATLAQTLLDYERQAKLVKTGAVSQAVLDQTIAKRNSAAAAVQKMEATIAQKTIIAPFAGRLGLRHVEKGQYCRARSCAGLAAIARSGLGGLSGARRRHRQVQLGSAVELAADAYPGQLFKGEVEAFDAKLGSDTRTLIVRARVPNSDRKLMPGMFANVAVLAGGRRNSLPCRAPR